MGDIVDQIAADLGYPPRRVREMRLLMALYRYGSEMGTEERIAYVRNLSDPALDGLSLQITVGAAEAAIDRSMVRLLGNLSPSHQIDGFDVGPGPPPAIMDQGRPAFEDTFDAEFWSRPPGSDRTLKDPLGILPGAEREFTLGRPVEAEEE